MSCLLQSEQGKSCCPSIVTARVCCPFKCCAVQAGKTTSHGASQYGLRLNTTAMSGTSDQPYCLAESCHMPFHSSFVASRRTVSDRGKVQSVQA